MPQANKSEVYRSQVLDRTFQILDILAEDGQGQGVTELADKLGLHKSTTHRLIMVLESSRYVERDGATSKYRLGSRIIELGLSALSRLDLYQIARPHLRELVAETGETAHIGVMRGGEIVSLVNWESTQALRTPSTIGTRHPSHCSSLGKAILAFSPPEELDRFLEGRTLERYTRHTIASPELFRKETETIRRTGYAVDDEEREDGLRCIGAPVFGSSGDVVAAVSIAGPVFRITRDRTTALAAAVMKTAGSISAALGFAPKTVTETTIPQAAGPERA
jgi:DNA-binding IclR family transcriptional regulator